MENFSMANSLKQYVKHRLTGDIRFPRSMIGNSVSLEDGNKAEIFRQVIFEKPAMDQSEAVLFHVKFRLKGMSPGMNKVFSNIPIPFFVGLPGFIAKFWCFDATGGDFHGFYKWKSAVHAESYSTSFAMKFMTKRSMPGSAIFEILPYSQNRYSVYPDID